MAERDEALRRIDELLLSRATEGLQAGDEAALRELLAAHPEVDEHAYEKAAAAVLLATLTHIDAMPESVKRAVSARAKR